ncbi:MAG: TatD family hydrolase [Elusimicrobiales bacterium]
MSCFDAHDHLQQYAGEAELEAALAAAEAAGVQGMLCCGTCPEDWSRVLEIAGRHAAVRPAFGLHPWFSAEGGWLEKLGEFLRRCPAACVGEIGLDGVKDRPGQEEDLKAQLELAERFRRPAVLHCVKSWGRLAELLKKNDLPAFMLHAYGGPPEMVKDLAALGAYFSFGGELTSPGRDKLRAALAAVPQDRLLFETDAPAGGGAPWHAGPAGVAEVVTAAAGLLGLPPEGLAALSLANTERFLGELQ